MATVAILVCLTYFVPFSYGQGPAYAYVQTNVDQLAEKMNSRDKAYRNVFKMFDEKLNTLNTSLSADTSLIYNSLTVLEGELLQGQNSSLTILNGMDNRTAKQLDDLKGEITNMQQDTTEVKGQLVKGQGNTEEILKAVSGVQDDYEDFKMKTASLWNIEANLTSIRTQLEENREHLDSELSDLRRELTNVVKEEMVAVQRDLASLLHDMSALKNNLTTKDSSPDCPSSWSWFQNSCYRVMDQPTKWKLAKLICNQMDSFLVEMYSEEEINYVLELAGNDTTTLWTGANIKQRGEWFWSESRSDVNLNLFSGQYPTGRKRAYCAAFVTEDKSLDDNKCGRKFPYICRKIAFHK